MPSADVGPEATDWVRAQAHRLSTLSPLDPLDDLEPLADLVGGARAVGLGEMAHSIREFHLLRHRVFRFLVERLGFTVLAVESGHAAGRRVDAYVQGAPDDPVRLTVEGLSYGISRAHEVADLLTWMRRHNETGLDRLQFVGIDIPSTGTLVPSLDLLDDYLAVVDPGAQEVTAAARACLEQFADPLGWVAMATYAALSQSVRDALTAALAELVTRLQCLRPSYVERGGVEAYELAHAELGLAVALDQTWRSHAAAGASTYDRHDSAALLGVTPRAAAKAAMVQLLLEQDPKQRVLLLTYNSHVQRTPVAGSPGFAAAPTCGQHLAAALGGEYVAIGVSGGVGHVSARRPNPAVRGGLELVEADLGTPEPGSFEGVMAASDVGLSALDLRPLRANPTDNPLESIRTMRMGEGYAEVEIANAFDVVVHVPRVSVAAVPTYDHDPWAEVTAW